MVCDMINIRKKEFDIFSLSFLDIISCGFGAVIMLILISKNADDRPASDHAQTDQLLEEVFSLRGQVQSLGAAIFKQSDENRALSEQGEQLSGTVKKLTERADVLTKQQAAAKADIEGLQLVRSTLQQAALSKKTTEHHRDEEVGGIPVDSDYVIFVIDTSGSMQQIWRRVSTEIINVLNIHPQVKGFQILNDLGKPLISGYEGKWIPDTPGRRKSVIKVFDSWGDISNSSPVEGIQVALKQYAKPTISTSIYVFGDDYTGASYDRIIDEITHLNQGKLGKKRLAKIHGIGFVSPHTTDRFAILMRELTRRNGGTFLALSD